MKKTIYTLLLAYLLVGCEAKSEKDTHDKNKESQIKENIMENDDNNTQHYIDAVDQYMRSLNESDLEGILSLYADSSTVEDPVGSRVVEGMENLRKFYTGAVNIDLEVKRTGPVRVAGVEVAFPFQLLMDSKGVNTLTDIIDVFRFNEKGKIISMRAYHGPSNRKQIDSLFDTRVE